MTSGDGKNSVAAQYLQGKLEWQGREGVVVETKKQGNVQAEGEEKSER